MKHQITLRLTADDLASMNELTQIIAGPRGSAFVGPTAVVRFAMKAAIEAAQVSADTLGRTLDGSHRNSSKGPNRGL